MADRPQKPTFEHHNSQEMPPWAQLRVPKTPKKPQASGSSSPNGKYPMYRGIRSRGGKWVSEIREPGQTTRIWLGTYPKPEMAAAAYDVAAKALKGSDAVLNFPGLFCSFPVPASSSPNDIRSAASRAAKLMKEMELSRGGNGSGGGGEIAQDVQYDHEEMHGNDEGGFIDEEALFDMPNLLVDMAGGMLVSPPRMNNHHPTMEDSDGERLWSYNWDEK